MWSWPEKKLVKLTVMVMYLTLDLPWGTIATHGVYFSFVV